MGRTPRLSFSSLLLRFPLSAFVRLFVCAATLLLTGIFSPAHAQMTNTMSGRSSQARYSRVVLGPFPISSSVQTSHAGGSGPGLTIIPTFDASIDAPTQAVIRSVIAYYEDAFQTNITVNIYFFNMNSGLAESIFPAYRGSYSSYRTALGNNATSADDETALANTPSGSANPVTATANIIVKSPSGRAVGLNTPEVSFAGSPCPGSTFTGSGCIGLNVSSANSLGVGVLRAAVEHEMDEVLGLGSALHGTTTPADPWTEDLFRWASPSIRSFAANASTTVPCSISTPSSFFSIDGGTTNLDQFNNCNNGGDYGDWVTHTPSQVQDAFTNGSADPSLLVSSPEVRALDVIGFKIAFKHFAEIAVWRPSTGLWFVIPQSNQGPTIVQQWGTSGDVPLRGDFDGDGITDISVWRPSTGQWFIIPSSSPGSPIVQQWGTSGDIPVPGDYDGDGVTDFAVFRPSTGAWFIIPSSNPGSPIVQQWGTSGDIPVPGDYDGDRKTDIAVFRPSSGTWFIIPSSNPGTPIVQQWGTNGDNPAPGDYDGDGKTDFAVWRPSTGTWFMIPSSNPGTPIVQQWGTSGDVPVPGDYDGDGKTDFAVWRPSTGTWYVIQSSSSSSAVTQWGTNGDVPIQKPTGQ
jgi:putative transposon-encoded protein